MTNRVVTRGALLCAVLAWAGWGQLAAQTLSEACGALTGPATPESAGRWLDWTEDHLGWREPPPNLEPLLDRLTGLAEPFRRAPVLNPPRGVEVRPHRTIWGPGPAELGPPLPRATLVIQVFHPTVAQAGEASATLRVHVNSLFPLTYGVGRPLAEDTDGVMFPEPVLVGRVGGAPVYWADPGTDCLVAFKKAGRPLWLPVSRGRYLEALVASLERSFAEADSAFMAAEVDPGADKEMEEAMRRLREMDPTAAAELERQMAEMKRTMAAARSGLDGSDGSVVSRELRSKVGELKRELESLGPAGREAPAWIGGAHASQVSLLSAPGDDGARRLVAPNLDYLDGEAPPDEIQLLVVELDTGADHAPEMAIVALLREQLDWGVFRSLVR